MRRSRGRLEKLNGTINQDHRVHGAIACRARNVTPSRLSRRSFRSPFGSRSTALHLATSLLRSHSPSRAAWSIGIDARSLRPPTREAPGLVAALSKHVTSLGACAPIHNVARVRQHRALALAHSREAFTGQNMETPSYRSLRIVRYSAPSRASMSGKRSRAFHD